LGVKCKYKIDYFDFFMNIALSGRKSQDQPDHILMFVGIAKKPIGPKKLPFSENFPRWNKKTVNIYVPKILCWQKSS